MVLCIPLRCHVHCYSNQDLISAGDVVLKDLKLKAEALNALKLPVTVKAGFVGTITLKVHLVIYHHWLSAANFCVIHLPLPWVC